MDRDAGHQHLASEIVTGYTPLSDLAREIVLGYTAARSGKLDRARSRLYRDQILQENIRLKALAEIYTMHSFAQLCTK